MTLFFRKERDALFLQRFASPSPPTNAWRLRSNVIFEAKNARGTKQMTVNFGGQRIALSCRVQGTSLAFTPAAGGATRSFTIAESDMSNLLTARPNTLEYAALAQVCRDHATSSRSSPLISGCAVDNFAASRTYPGRKLCLDLKVRQPFANPFVSGREREFFLVGQVASNDCRLIKYFGATNENLDVLVNHFGSRLPRPA